MRQRALLFFASLFLHHGRARVPVALSVRSKVIKLRGGGDDSPPIEENPNYIPRQGITLGDIDERAFIPPPPPPQYAPTAAAVSLLERIKQFAMQLHSTSPTLSVTSFSCIFIFCMWQVPSCHAFLQKYFVCSRDNLRRRRLISALLSAVSHASIGHLMVNLFAFLSFGPQLRQTLYTSANWPLWPLVMGAALVGSTTFCLLSRHGSCLGLSGVTLSFLALYSKLYPKQEIGVALMGILPVRLPAQHALSILLVWSVVGTILSKRSRVAHQAHLGGLLFGMLYHELWLRRSRLRKVTHTIKTTLRPSKKL